MSRIRLLAATVPLLTAAACDVSIEFCARDDAYVPLDQTAATLVIDGSADRGDATVAFTLRDACGDALVLADGQGVSLNGAELAGPGDRADSSNTVPLAENYEFTLREPTRGVLTLDIELPATFEFSSPEPGGPASLSGFELAWSPAEPGASVRVQLDQILFGEQRTAEFGPLADTGSLSLAAEDLRDFRQGEDLAVSVTKLLPGPAGDLFQSATIQTSLSLTMAVVPAP